MEVALEELPGNQALLRVVNHIGQHSQRVHLCLVLDASVSMTAPLQGKNAAGEDIIYRGSVLDMVLFAAKLAVDCLDDNDVISVVRFSDRATVVVPPTLIDGGAGNRKDTINHIHEAIMTIETTHGSHLWGGILAGLNCLREFQQENQHDQGDTIYNVCMAFTDGEPNRAPATGWLGVQSRYQNAFKFSDYTLNTLGFGHALDSKLLMHLARDGNGVYANVPDCRLLGTVFTNMLAQAKVTTHKRLRLRGSVNLLQRAVGNYLAKKVVEEGAQSWYIELGTLADGQVRFFVLDLARPLADLYDEAQQRGRRISLYLEATSCQQQVQQGLYPEEHKFDGPFYPATDDVLLPVLRSQASVELMSLHGSLAAAIKAVRLARLKTKTNPAGEHGLYEALQAMEVASAQAVEHLAAFCNGHPALMNFIGMPLEDEYDQDDKPTGVAALYADLMHQVKIALGREHFERWGHSYLLALAMAYQQHFTLNGMDPGVQGLSGPCFEQKADQLSIIFDACPITTPTERNDRVRDPRCMSLEARPLEEGLQINNQHGGCYSSDSLVSLADGNTKTCADVRPGDVLLGGGVVAKVAKFLIKDGHTKFCPFEEGLWITPYHPVCLKERGWVFPCHVVKAVTMKRASMYSFVLEAGSGHVAVVGGVETITLGHNITSNAVLKHGFFGSDKIRERLDELDLAGFKTGVVTLQPGCFVRDNNNLVVDVC
jgi:Mg-chelatase subunit ChlD